MSARQSTRPAGKPAMSPAVAQALEQAQCLDKEIANTLRRASAVLRLASFACEARRVLEEIDFRSQHVRGFAEVLDGIHAWRQWSAIDEDPSQVLDDLADDLQDLGVRLDNDGGPAFMVGAALEADHV